MRCSKARRDHEVEQYVVERGARQQRREPRPLLETSAPTACRTLGRWSRLVAAGLALLEGAQLPRELRGACSKTQLELMLELTTSCRCPGCCAVRDERAERHALGCWLP